MLHGMFQEKYNKQNIIQYWVTHMVKKLAFNKFENCLKKLKKNVLR